MNSEIVFQGIDNDLVLDVVTYENGWTLCYFVSGKQRLYLGAETIGYIVTGLLEGLEKPSSKPMWHLEGEEVYGVLALAERHHCLYASYSLPKQKLFWQDAHCNPVRIIGLITIEDEQRKQWRKQLELLREQWSNTPFWNYRS